MSSLNRIKTILVFMFLTVPAALMAHWNGPGYWGGPGPGCGFNRFFAFGGGWIMHIVSIIILALIIIFGIKLIKSGKANPFKSEDPLTILKTRYAKGEITKEEFNEMKKEL